MIHLLANRPFVRFWVGRPVLPARGVVDPRRDADLRLRPDRSPFATGLIPVFASLPGIVLGPVAGVLVDRWDRRRVMVVSAVAIAVLLLAALPVTVAGEVRPALLFAIIFLQAIAMAFFSPAEKRDPAPARRRR